jgi:hypothetical protein
MMSSRQGHGCVVWDDTAIGFGGGDLLNFSSDVWRINTERADEGWDKTKCTGN